MERSRKRSLRVLRLKIIKQINKWQPHLNAIAIPAIEKTDSKLHLKVYKRFIYGVTKDGRAFLIYPKLGSAQFINAKCSEMMLDFEHRGAVVGVAYNILDAWDILFCDEKEYKRKKRTYYYRNTKKRGSSDDSEE